MRVDVLSPDDLAHGGGSMNSIARLVVIAIGVVLVLTTTPSWGQPALNPTISDGQDNTGGGTGALGTCLGKTVAPCTGLGGNTAFGFFALFKNTVGVDNTASGILALQSNTSGNFNTATGFEALASNNTGSFNTATGAGALSANATGVNNTANGYLALSA